MDSPPHLVKLWQQRTEPAKSRLRFYHYETTLSYYRIATLFGGSETIHSGETMNTVRWMIGRVIATTLVFGALATPDAAEIRKVQMRIAGYLCGN